MKIKRMNLKTTGLLIAGGIVLVALVLAALAFWPRELVLYTWEEMFPEDILEEFERENPGLKVVYKTFEYNEDMIEQLDISRGGGYDLVIAEDYIIDFVISYGLARKLDKARLDNLAAADINPLYLHQFYDPDNEYTIPYGAGVPVIVYDPAKVPFEIKGFADLWDPALRGRVGITENYRVINGMALQAMGKSYNEEAIEIIRAAGDLLKALAPNIRVIRDIGLEKELIGGSIFAALMYPDQAMKSKLANPGFEMVFPEEGIGFSILAAFIPRRAPNPSAAYRFLNFILEPERAARCFEYLGYYCTYLGAEPLIDPVLKEYLILPSFRNFEMLLHLPQEVEAEHTRIWKEFKAAVSR
jgi:spermidine/putrescine transport system substrate-binding protein